MKKLIMALVCLMTMVMLTSCSSDDEDITEQYSTAILGGWKCEENNNGAEFWFGQDGTAYLLYFDNGVYDYGVIANYSITGNHLSLINISNDSSDITYWNNKIDEVEKEEASSDQDYSVIVYIVKKGDTLWNIAKRFRTTVDFIARTNGIEDENKLQPGQKLYIPRYSKISF